MCLTQLDGTGRILLTLSSNVTLESFYTRTM